MIGELVKTYTEDKLLLHGFLVLPKEETKWAMLHIHGVQGNFYENDFIQALADACGENNVALLSANNRGVNVETDFWAKNEKGEDVWRTMGAAHETLEEAIPDVQAWKNFLKERGFTSFIIEGHSLGTLKAAYYVSAMQGNDVRGLILLAPVDLNVLDDSSYGKDAGSYKDAIRKAKVMVQEKRGRDLLPKEFVPWPLDARAFMSWFGTPEHRIFNFGSDEGTPSRLATVTVPTLVIAGSKDRYIKNPERALKLVSAQIKGSRAHLIKGADHWYLGFFDELKVIVSHWLKEVVV